MAVKTTLDVVGASFTGRTDRKPGRIELSELFVSVKITSPLKLAVGVKIPFKSVPFDCSLFANVTV